jgi:hypothetical protein
MYWDLAEAAWVVAAENELPGHAEDEPAAGDAGPPPLLDAPAD